MAEYSDNKFQNMVDEMSRFEEEIGLPYIPEIDPRLPRTVITSQPFVIGTNTFSRAQQKIESQVPFIPSQVSTLPNGIPPPPAPPLSIPPAGMRFNSGIPVPYSQPIPPPPQPPTFPNPLMVSQETPSVSSTTTGSSPATLTRRTASWPVHAPLQSSSTTTNTETQPPEEFTKVVLSATPKLYTPMVEKVEDISLGIGTISRLPSAELSRSIDSNIAAKKFKPNEPPKYAPGPSYYVGLDQGDKRKDKKKKFIRVSGGQTWEDHTLTEWDDGDFRLFCGDLGNDVTDELLTRIFSRYPSFMKAKVVRDKRTNKTKGFGFVSFKDPQDFIKASKEMNGRYVGSRPIKLRKSTWKNRNLDTVKKKEKEKAALIAALTGKS